MSKQSEATLLLKIKTEGEALLGKAGDALSKLGQIAAAVYASANALAIAAIHAYKEQEEATNSLNQSLINQGIYTKSLSKSYQDIASELQKVTTYGDEAIISAQAQIQRYIGQEKVTKELTKATLDFATAMGMDLASAANVVGKSVGSNTNMLARYGIQIDENTTKSVKLAEVTQQLSMRFGGQAEAQAQGLGSLKMMTNAMGEVLETIGARLAPVVIYAAKSISEFAFELANNQLAIQNFQAAAVLLGKTGSILKNVIMGLGETFGQVFGTIAGVAEQLAEGKFKEAFETIKSGFTGTADSIKDRYSTLTNELTTIDDLYKNEKQRADKEELERSKKNADSKKKINEESVFTEKQLFEARDLNEITRDMDKQRLKNDAHLIGLTRQINNEKDHTKQLELERRKREYLDGQFDEMERKRIFNLADFKQNMHSKGMRDFESVLSNMAAMQSSKSKVLVGIGKAAAIAQMTISTARATVEAFEFGSDVGGPVLGGVLAAPIPAWGAAQIASIAGIELAEGGIVKATPGGVHAIIGEGGRDEMVIPLEKGSGAPNMGTKISIQVYGGFLGNDAQAKEFAVVLDKELMKLRQSNESLAFDKGII